MIVRRRTQVKKTYVFQPVGGDTQVLHEMERKGR